MLPRKRDSILGLSGRERKIFVGAVVLLMVFCVGFAWAGAGDVSLGGASNSFEGNVVVTGTGTFGNVEGAYPSGAYTYMIFPYINATGTYYMAKHSNGSIIVSWTSTNANTLINSALSVGGNIFLQRGTYTGITTLNVNVANTTLYGDNSVLVPVSSGFSNITLTASGSDETGVVSDSLTVSPIIYVTANNAAIRGLTIQANGANTHFARDGILFYNCQNFLAEQNKFYNISGCAIRTRSNGTYSVANPYTSSSLPTSDGIIRDNMINETQSYYPDFGQATDDVISFGIELEFSANVQVYGNSLYNVGQSSLRRHYALTTSFIENYVENNRWLVGGDGIDTYRSANWKNLRNTINHTENYRCDYLYEFLQDGLIQGNTYISGTHESDPQYNIRIVDHTGVGTNQGVTNIKILENTLSGGMLLEQDNMTLLDVSRNTIHGQNTPSGDLILEPIHTSANVTSNVISWNIFTKTTGTNILLDHNATALVQSNTVTSKIVFNAVAYGTKAVLNDLKQGNAGLEDYTIVGVWFIDNLNYDLGNISQPAFGGAYLTDKNGDGQILPGVTYTNWESPKQFTISGYTFTVYKNGENLWGPTTVDLDVGDEFSWTQDSGGPSQTRCFQKGS